MSADKHTPGLVEDCTPTTLQDAIENAKRLRQTSADLGYPLSPRASYIVALDDCRAEMLDALRDLMKSCENWAPTIDRSRARAAIAKAEGR